MKSAPWNTRIFYGWIIVFVSGLGIFFSGPGQTYSNSVFIELYISDLHLDRTTLSTLYAVATLAAGFLILGVGKLADRFGIRTVLTVISLLLGLACFWNSNVIGPVTLFLGFFMIRLLGQGSMTMIPNTLVSVWFMRLRGRALAFAGLGGLLSAAFFPPFVNWLIESFDWRIAWKVLGALVIIIFTPLAYYFIRNRPDEIGMRPDGQSPHEAPSGRTSMEEEDSWTLSEALRNRTFWFLILCTTIPAMLYTGVTFQVFSIMDERGINRATTAFILSLVPLVSFGFSLISGFLTEKIKPHLMLAASFLLNILAPILLLMTQSVFMAIGFGIAWGIAQGMMNIPLRAIWPEYYGRKHLGSINSVNTAATVIGSSLGPIPFGFIYDQLGSYNLILWVSIFVWLAGAVLAFLSRQPVKS